MNRKTSKVAFERLPKGYTALCRVLMPRCIRDRVDFENVNEVASAMAGHKLTRDQADYFELLCRLIEDYEKERVSAHRPRVTGLEALRHLLAENNLKAADLARLLGVHRTLGAMILRGERQLTVSHIRTLAERFAVSGDLFLTA